MGASNINRVVMTGNLTADPELRSTPSGASICKLRLANNTREKRGDEWTDYANYFDVTVWGAQGENVAKYMSKGSPVCVDGRLRWREWTDKDGNKRQGVEVIADSVQFLPDGKGGGQQERTGRSDVLAHDDFAQPPAGEDEFRNTGDDDVPFLCEIPSIGWDGVKATNHNPFA